MYLTKYIITELYYCCCISRRVILKKNDDLGSFITINCYRFPSNRGKLKNHNFFENESVNNHVKSYCEDNIMKHHLML